MATAGLPDPVLAPPPPADLVAIAVGKTHEGAPFPANPRIRQTGLNGGVMACAPSFENPVPLEMMISPD